VTKKDEEIQCSITGPDGQVGFSGTIGDMKRIVRDLKRPRKGAMDPVSVSLRQEAEKIRRSLGLKSEG